MMGFLHPFALLGLTALALPIVIHLFTPRKVRVTSFSSLRWLKHSPHRKAKRIRWHQTLLFLTRAAMLTLVVLALAQPYMTSGGENQPVDRLIVLDAGRTLGYAYSNGQTPMSHARDAAIRLLQNHRHGDRAAVAVASGAPRVQVPWTDQPARHIQAIQEIMPSPRSTTLEQLSPSLRMMIGRARPNAVVELVFITDNQAAFWSGGAANHLRQAASQQGQTLRVRVVDVSPAMPVNAWIAQAAIHVDESGGRQVAALVASQAGQPVARRLVLADMDGAPLAQQEISTQAGRQWVTLPMPATMHDPMLELRLEPADSLADDDRRWLSLASASASTRVLLVCGPGDASAAAAAQVHLQAAMEALRTSRAPGLSVVSRRPDELASRDFDGVDVIILADVPQVHVAWSQSLARRVAQGAQLILFTGQEMNAASYDNTHLLPALIGPVQRSTTPLRIVPVMPSHELIEGLFDPTYGELNRVNVRRWRELVPHDQAQVIARIGQHAPLIMQRRIGEGSTVLVNTTANDAWSDLARRQVFITLLDRLIARAVGRDDLAGHGVAGPVSVTLADAAEEPDIRVAGPENQHMATSQRSVAGATEMTILSPPAPGIYHVTYRVIDGGHRRIALAVQPDHAGSDLMRMHDDALAALWQDVDLHVSAHDAGDAQPILAAPGWASSSGMLLAMAILAAMVEMLLAHRACPAVNPKIVTTPAPGGGKPTSLPGQSSSDGLRRGKEAASA